MNLVEAVVEDGAVTFSGFQIPLSSDRRPRGGGSRVILGIRPESFEDAAFAEPGLPQLDVEVEVLEELGSDAHVIFRVDAPRVDNEELRAATDEEDESLLADERTSHFNARVDPRTKARVGSRIVLAVDPSSLHFFDGETGQSLTGSATAA
jgi:multiple sugar transport system ATP-binding protein